MRRGVGKSCSVGDNYPVLLRIFVCWCDDYHHCGVRCIRCHITLLIYDTYGKPKMLSKILSKQLVLEFLVVVISCSLSKSSDQSTDILKFLTITTNVTQSRNFLLIVVNLLFKWVWKIDKVRHSCFATLRI